MRGEGGAGGRGSFIARLRELGNVPELRGKGTDV